MRTEDLRLMGKRILFPGLDLHTRCRYRMLPRFFSSGPVETLDAGCGNGALSYAAYKLGNSVLGVTNDKDQADKVRRLFSAWKADPRRLRVGVCDLCDLPRLGREFDQIICSETLEHIRGDRQVIRYFHDILCPGGVIHLCSPFAVHPEHALGRTGGGEDGGHVRDGYTLESYRSLLEPSGFRITASAGLGSPLLVRLDRSIRSIRNGAGDMAALPLFLFTWPAQLLDRMDPDMPFSLYVRAVKE